MLINLRWTKMGKFHLCFLALEATSTDSQIRVGAISFRIPQSLPVFLAVAFSSRLASFIHFQNQEFMFRKFPVYKRWNRPYILCLVTPSKVPFSGYVFMVYYFSWWLSNQILSISMQLTHLCILGSLPKPTESTTEMLLDHEYVL